MAGVAFNKITPLRFERMLKWIAQKAPCQEVLLRLNERVIKPIVRDKSLVSPESRGQLLIAPELIQLKLSELPARECYSAADNQDQPWTELNNLFERGIYGLSVIGKRHENQDKLSVFFYQDKTYLLAADGMGGSRGGEFAARIAVQEIEKWIKNGMSVEEAINLAHERIKIARKSWPELAQMGTTLVMIEMQNGRATVYNIGDSLAFLADRASNDIALLNDLDLPVFGCLGLDGPPFRGREEIDAVLALGRMNHGLRYAVGCSLPETIRPLTVELQKGDRLFLASDGLALYYAELLAHFFLTDPLNVIVRQLIDQALWEKEDMGQLADNISVIVFEY